MLERYVKPAVDELYPLGNCFFQDDEAKIHRTPLVLETVDRLFKHRVPPGIASVTADLYSVENLWSILKSEAASKAPITSVKALKNILTKKWREINSDKGLCQRMIASHPKRCTAMIRLNGDQVHKRDYAGPSGDM